MEPVTNNAEQRLYLQFFEHLDITEQKKLPFLCSLLRNLYDAASKLDLHLAPYGAALHCAVSRMVVSVNPEEAPTHHWIRVVDRLEFFTDANTHSERIVNLGLAYAYRHLEADALAEASALLLRKAQPAASRKEPPTEGGLPRGGAIVSTTTANPAAATAGRSDMEPGRIDGGDDGQEEVVPAGGRVIFTNGQTSGHAPDDGGDKEEDDGGGEDEGLVPQSGLFVSVPGSAGVAGRTRTMGGRGSADDETDSASRRAMATAAEATDSADLDAADDGDAGFIPPHVLHDHQPTVHPPASAVKVVVSVLRTVINKADGKDVLRKLLGDGVLCLARSRSEPSAAPGIPRLTGSKADAAAIQRMCRAWWPHWKAPQDLGSTKPPDGTLAFLLNRKRLAASSRWAILVDLAGIISALEDMSFQSSALFKKDKLPAVECVQRVSGKSPMKMTVVIACLLLMVTKEEQFSTILTDLAFAGRADVNKNAPLTAASRHEFYTAGLAPSASEGNVISRTGSASNSGPADVPAFEDGLPQNITEEYASMASDVAVDNSKEAARRRAQRVELLKSRPRARGARPPVARKPRTASAANPGAGGAPPPPATHRGTHVPEAGAIGGGPVAMDAVGVTVVQGGSTSATVKATAKAPKTARPARPRKVATGAAPARNPAAGVRAASAKGAPDGERDTDVKLARARPHLRPLPAVVHGALAGLSLSGGPSTEPTSDVRMGVRGATNVVVGTSASGSELGGVSAPSTLSTLPIQSIGTVGVGAGVTDAAREVTPPAGTGAAETGVAMGVDAAEERRMRHARVAADMSAASASLALLLPVRYPDDAARK
ncbi:hypothetical protein BU14_0219s0029 [Porphyra umbilicalis]|uniref:Uncharacterized protein n=1 Tax=Porphyra umbilicalis TaxID=2786 RepID=A0A1X6P4L2_PORUM|nr:hypothetical protein BU14_0219s0029 [Porphyra umbilicalis]|eukprot:OSX75829.1 hypothetical protein BU14_0219s0029 [Porphyra umbilicalis]